MEIPLDIKRISIIASGSSYNAGLLGKYFFENISDIETNVSYASEIASSRFDNFDSTTLYIFISQSGKSSDVIKSFEKIKKCGARTVGITNNTDSDLYNKTDISFDISAGRELAIAATKTFTASILVLWFIAIKIAQNKRIDVTSEIKNIYLLKNDIEATLNNIDNIDMAVKLLSGLKDFSIFGMGYYYPLAREAALKIKELCYINTGSYPVGEFIHGHFAVLNKSKVFLTFITKDSDEQELELLNKIISTYNTKSVVISDGYEDFNCDILVKFVKGSSKIATILSLAVVIQLIALRCAIRLKRNIDKPIGLNKVVNNKQV